MCGPLNREGPLCEKCKDGYGIALYSYKEDPRRLIPVYTYGSINFHWLIFECCKTFKWINKILFCNSTIMQWNNIMYFETRLLFCTDVATELNCFWLKLPSVLMLYLTTDNCCLPKSHVFRTVWFHTSHIPLDIVCGCREIHLKCPTFIQSISITPVTVGLHGKQLPYLNCGTIQILCVTEFLNCVWCQNLDDAVNNVN